MNSDMKSSKPNFCRYSLNIWISINVHGIAYVEPRISDSVIYILCPLLPFIFKTSLNLINPGSKCQSNPGYLKGKNQDGLSCTLAVQVTLTAPACSCWELQVADMVLISCFLFNFKLYIVNLCRLLQDQD